MKPMHLRCAALRASQRRRPRPWLLCRCPRRAAAALDFVAEAARLSGEDIGRWIKARYQAECSAVLALDRVVKAAALAGVWLGWEERRWQVPNGVEKRDGRFSGASKNRSSQHRA